VEQEEQEVGPTDFGAVTAAAAAVRRELVAMVPFHQALVPLWELVVRAGMVQALLAVSPSSIMGRDEHKTVGLLPSRTC
jgi:hypothetical protein